jgi:hypothetical protein
MSAIRKQFKERLSQWKDCPSNYICCNHSFIRYICQWIVIVFIHTKSIFLASVAWLFPRAFISSVREQACNIQTKNASKPIHKSIKIQNKHKKFHRKSKQETAFCLNLVALVFDLSYIHLSRFQRLRFSDAHFEFFHISIYPFSREFDVCDSVMPILCVCLCVCVCVCFYIVHSSI